MDMAPAAVSAQPAQRPVPLLSDGTAERDAELIDLLTALGRFATSRRGDMNGAVS